MIILLPETEITDAILEINGFTGFCDEFTHISESHARAKSLGLSLCAVLTAQACNIGLEPMVDPANPALSLGRLQWVQQNNFVTAIYFHCGGLDLLP